MFLFLAIMRIEGQHQSQGKRVRFDLPYFEASTPTTVRSFSSAKSKDRGTQEPTSLSARPRPEYQPPRRRLEVRTISRLTSATRSTACERSQGIRLKLKNRTVTMQRLTVTETKIQIHCSPVDKVAVSLAGCRLE